MRLAALVLAIALVTSRLGLVVHELVGHGLVAAALGSDVTGWHLYAFGGGWLGFAREAPYSGVEPYLVYLGGMAAELVLAAVASLVARRRTGVARLVLAGAAWALALHAGWYLAAGTFHGFGDGWILHRRLGDGARAALVIAVGLAIVGGAAVAGRRLVAGLRAMAPATTSRRQLAVVAAAVAAGLAGHAALTFAELRLTPDTTYGITMRTAGERATEHELVIAVERAERAGRPLDATAVSQTRRALAEKHRQAPVGALLVVAMAIAAIAGAAGTTPVRDARAPSRRAVAVVGAVAGASIALVLALAALAP